MIPCPVLESGRFWHGEGMTSAAITCQSILEPLSAQERDHLRDLIAFDEGANGELPLSAEEHSEMAALLARHTATKI